MKPEQVKTNCWAADFLGRLEPSDTGDLRQLSFKDAAGRYPSDSPEATVQYMAGLFDRHAKRIAEELARFACRTDAPELGDLYRCHRAETEVDRKITWANFKVVLPSLPSHPGRDFYKGLSDLANYGAEAARSLTATTTATASKRSPDASIEWFARALLLVKKHPEKSDRTIASLVSVNPSTLSRNAVYQQAAKMAREGMSIPPGSKDKDGNMEASMDDDNE